MTRNGRIGIVCVRTHTRGFAAFLAGVAAGIDVHSGPATIHSLREVRRSALTITDAPPAGVTVLSFEVTVNGAVLNPGNVSLISAPQKIEVKELETESAFLSTANVPAGTYQSITVNFTNPELTIMNQSGAAIGNCANNSVCHIEPAAAGNISFSSAPFPVTLHGGDLRGFQFDVNLANLISNIADAGLQRHRRSHRRAAPAARASLLTISMTSTICSAACKTSTPPTKNSALHTLTGDFPSRSDSNTEFELEGCAADDFSCLAKRLGGRGRRAADVGRRLHRQENRTPGQRSRTTTSSMG